MAAIVARSRAFLLVFLLVLAPVGAAVLIAALLLFGARPAMVFAPGHAMIALLRALGANPPNAIGVVTTVGAWWIVIAAAGLLWERSRH